MYPVSSDFQAAIAASERATKGRVIIDYTDPELDPTISPTASEEGNHSYPGQTADAIEDPAYKYLSLDGSCQADGTYHVAPGTDAAAQQYQMGWWGSTAAGAGGAFSAPYPTLTVTFASRPVTSLRVAGDSKRGEHPVDFTIKLYGSGDSLLHTETVTGNTEVTWSQTLDPAVTGVVKQVLEITKWSHASRTVKIVEFYTGVREVYEGDELLELSLLEEREASQGTLPVGNISANEIVVKLNNSSRKFDADNSSSPLFQLLKPNRRIRAWIGAELADGSVEYVPVGLFWSLDWQASEETVEASVVGRDRLERLRKTTYQGGPVQQNTTIYDMAVAVLQDAGLAAGQYSVDTALQDKTVPYGWLNPMSHREALRIIAEAGLAVVFADRDGAIQVKAWSGGLGGSSVLTITSDDYFRVANPMRLENVANEVVVTTEPRGPAAAAEEVYRSNETISIPAGESVTVTAEYTDPPVIEATASLEGHGVDTSITAVTYYGWGAEVTITNAGAADDTATLVINGKPLSIRGRQRATAKDADSQTDQGVLRYEYPGNHLIQTETIARDIAHTLLASAKDSRRDLEVHWRGNPALELGDRITVGSADYHVIRQELDWTGALAARLTGRRVAL